MTSESEQVRLVLQRRDELICDLYRLRQAAPEPRDVEAYQQYVETEIGLLELISTFESQLDVKHPWPCLDESEWA